MCILSFKGVFTLITLWFVLILSADMMFPYPVRSLSWHPQQHLLAVAMVRNMPDSHCLCFFFCIFFFLCCKNIV
jgi:hypothetical protein